MSYKRPNFQRKCGLGENGWGGWVEELAQKGRPNPFTSRHAVMGRLGQDRGRPRKKKRKGSKSPFPILGSKRNNKGKQQNLAPARKEKKRA